MAKGEKRGCLRAKFAALVVVAVVLAGGLWWLRGGSSLVRGLFAASSKIVSTQDLPAREASYTFWDADESPDYWRLVGTADVDCELAAGEVRYSPLDSLGRTGRAVANVTYQMMETGIARDRNDIRDIHPSGWTHNSKVSVTNPDGSVYTGSFYNRSHLIAKSLGGTEVAENLVTGTHEQNVGDLNGEDGGMGYTEMLARRWLKYHHDGTVWYSATPVYDGDELVCRSVIVDVLSSDGSLDVEVEVYNVAAGYEIDYATGKFWKI